MTSAHTSPSIPSTTLPLLRPLRTGNENYILCSDRTTDCISFPTLKTLSFILINGRITLLTDYCFNLPNMAACPPNPLHIQSDQTTWSHLSPFLLKFSLFPFDHCAQDCARVSIFLFFTGLVGILITAFLLATQICPTAFSASLDCPGKRYSVSS